MKNDCIFCAITENEIPAYKIYEDEIFTAILDRFPKCPGHTLIIPKLHVKGLLDIPDEISQKLLPLSSKIAKKLYEIIGCDGLNVLQNNGEAAGMTIPHFHLHLIPRFKNDDMDLRWEPTDPAPEEFTKIMDYFK